MLCLLQRRDYKVQREINTLYIITRRIQVQADTSGRRLESHRTAFRPRWGVSRSLRVHSSRCGVRVQITIGLSRFTPARWPPDPWWVEWSLHGVRVSTSIRWRSGTSTGDPLDICTGRQMRVQAEERPRDVMRAAGRENTPGLRSSRRNTATVRFARLGLQVCTI